MGGTKRKIKIQLIEDMKARQVAFSKRRPGLYRKATDLGRLDGGQFAILTTPVSSNSHVSFHSFSNSSVDSVVSAFLTGRYPNNREQDMAASKKKGLGFWWEDESFSKSENLEELSDALEAISSMLKNLDGLHSKAVKKQDDLKKKKKDHNQTLTLQGSSSGSLSSIEEHNQTVAFSDNNMDHDQTLITLQGSSSGSLSSIEEHNQIVAFSDNNMDYNQTLTLQGSSSGSLSSTEEHNQIVAFSSDSNNNNNVDEDEFSLELEQILELLGKSEEDENQKLDLDQNTSSVIIPLSCSGSESVEAGAMAFHSNQEEVMVEFDQAFDYVSCSECLSMNLD